MFANDLSFYFPQMSWLMLFALFIFYGQIALERYRQRQQQLYTSPALLSNLLTARSFGLTHAKTIGWIIIWICACLALMGPFGNVRYSHSAVATLPSSSSLPHEIVFLVDTSASMLVPDGPEGKSRLEEAQAIMEDVVRLLQGQTVSLYAFDSRLIPLVPPTLDYLFLRLAIRDLSIDQKNEGGTRFDPVLRSLQQQVLSQPLLKRYTILLFSDGGDTQLEKLQGAAREREFQSILESIPYPQTHPIRLFTIGVGSRVPHLIPHVTFQGQPVYSALEPQLLQQLAEKKGGIYYQADEWSTWDLAQGLMREVTSYPLSTAIPWAHPPHEATVQPKNLLADLYYQIPLGLALFFYMLNLLLPAIRQT
jgi:Ca-activated chloride channel homolog